MYAKLRCEERSYNAKNKARMRRMKPWGTRRTLVRTWYVPGTTYLVRRTWYDVRRTWYLVRRTWYATAPGPLYATCAGPDLWQGRLGTRPGAPTKKGPHQMELRYTPPTTPPLLPPPPRLRRFRPRAIYNDTTPNQRSYNMFDEVTRSLP